MSQNDLDAREEARILASLRALEGAPPESVPRAPAGETGAAAADDEDATLERLYLETLGLIPYAEEPATPPAAAKRRLMAAIGAAGGAAAADAPENVVPLAARRAAEPGAPAASAAPAGGTAPGPSARVDHGWGAPHWLAAVAAVFALAAIALAAFLWVELDRARGALADAEAERMVLASDLESRQAGFHSERGRLLEAVSLMSTRGVEICPLHPVGEAPLQPAAFAVLYMVPGKGEWYLQATNLEPPPAGAVYRVWFLTPRGPVAGGDLEPGPKAGLQIAPGALDEKEVLSVSVTLEQDVGTPSPTGPPVLYGEEKMQVI